MSEYVKTIGEYPNIDFVGNSPSKDKSLFLLECASVAPQNYISEHLEKYKKIYTWNGILYDEYKKKGYNVIKIPNFPLFDNFYSLDNFVQYEDKINGICLICRYRQDQRFDFDISYKRIEVFESLDGIIKHCYGKNSYCGEYYKGVIGEGKGTYPSSKEKLDVLNKYKFNLCFENAFHELWSNSYVTEKIIDCFKSKCIAVYYGCYNIQDRIPDDLYIDYRKFDDDYDDLVKYMNDMSKQQYIDMTEKAFEWEKENKLGNIDELKEILDND